MTPTEFLRSLPSDKSLMQIKVDVNSKEWRMCKRLEEFGLIMATLGKSFNSNHSAVLVSITLKGMVLIRRRYRLDKERLYCDV